MIDKARIEELASNIYSKHCRRGVPAKMLPKIAKAENIKLREVTGSDNFLGSLVKSPKGSLYICVNSGIENIGRKNFTLAHELGHFVLEHHLHTSSFICNESDIAEEGDASTPNEREANYFASCFLLPRDRVVKEFTNWFIWRKGMETSVFLSVSVKGKSYSDWKAVSSKLTTKFDVSATALKIRLIELGLINNF